MSTEPGTLTYVYAVTRQTEHLTDVVSGLRGIDAAPVTLLADTSDAASDPLAFVVSPVSHRDFNETALKTHFEDLRWLENVARAHHDVVQAVAAAATVLPLRMATVYQDDTRARQALGGQRRTFTQRLAALEAHTEYGVKIYLPPPAASTAGEPSGEVGTAPPTTPGKAYLQRRRIQHHAREKVYEQAQLAAATIEAIAARFTSQRIRHAPQSGALSGPQENVLNDAYLIADEHAQQFRAAMTDAARDFPDIRIEVTGPWAPYSFAMAPADAPVPADGDERAERAP
ncbi:GvpL/GvpF family gas vesicle protein [Streptomyces yangpuensis]|uniref:GvpL/GvpF family gas vesicle protein n=1 Tax=Streptomyces yangpuensis TaxID=1648182 RepID=UPI000629443E|nr:GvpL/GvpF family gas vesicle protein [Streptomyces yangpuensis]